MENKDSIHLLKECDAGTKMATSSIDEVLDRVKDEKLFKLLYESKNHHAQLGNKIHSMLIKYGSNEKDPALMAKGMSWLKTNVKLELEPKDSTVAELITDGCDMGIKSLNQYLNQYKDSDDEVKAICKELIKIEDDLSNALREYL